MTDPLDQTRDLQDRVATLEKLLQTYGDQFVPIAGDYVKKTGDTMTGVLVLPTGPDVGGAGGGALQIGQSTNDRSLGIDDNEIQSYDNNPTDWQPGSLNLNIAVGGPVTIGKVGTGTITIRDVCVMDGTLTVTGALTASNVMTVEGQLDVNDDVKIRTTANDAVQLIGDTDTLRPYLSFWNHDASHNLDRKGYVGYPEADNNASNLSLVSDQGHLRITANTTGKRVYLQSESIAIAEQSGGTDRGIVGGLKHISDAMSGVDTITATTEATAEYPSGLSIAVVAPRAGAIAIISVTVDWEATSAPSVKWLCIAHLRVGGTREPDDMQRYTTTTTDRFSISKTWVISLPTGTTVVDVGLWKFGGTGGTIRINATHSVIDIAVFS